LRELVGVAWYSPATWGRLKNAVPDPELLEDSHAEWLKMMRSYLAKMGGAGIRLVRIDIDAEEFLAWCREHDRPADAGARAHFTAEKLRLRDLAGELGDHADEEA